MLGSKSGSSGSSGSSGMVRDTLYSSDDSNSFSNEDAVLLISPLKKLRSPQKFRSPNKNLARLNDIRYKKTLPYTNRKLIFSNKHADSLRDSPKSSYPEKSPHDHIPQIDLTTPYLLSPITATQRL